MPFCTAQEKTTVAAFLQAGPYAVSAPFALDTVDVQGKKFDDNSLMSAIGLTAPATQTFSGAVLPSLPGTKSVGVLSFYLNNSSYLKGRIEVAGPKNCKLYIDGVEKVLAGTPGAASGELMLAPEHHTFAIRYLAEPSGAATAAGTLSCATSRRDASCRVPVTASAGCPRRRPGWKKSSSRACAYYIR